MYMTRVKIMKEIWKKIDWIPDIRGEYEISNLGNVRRTALLQYDRYTNEYKTIYKTRNLLPYDNGHGYLHITVPTNTKSGIKQKILYIHRLVAEAFLDNPNNKAEVNHKNYIRSDNRVINLEWCTKQENSTYSSVMDKRLKPHYPSKGSKFGDNNFTKEQRITIKKSQPKYNYNNRASSNNNRVSSKKPIEERNVFLNKGKYAAYVGYNNTKIYCGRFENFEDAVNARIAKLKELNLIE